MKTKTKIINHSSKKKDSFYFIFLDEIPTVTADMRVCWIVCECCRFHNGVQCTEKCHKGHRWT